MSEPALVLPEPSDRLAVLFDAHEDRLYRLARRLVPTAEDARDLVHDAFLKAAKSLTSVPVGHPREEAWLVRVLVNIRRDQWRKTKVRKQSAVTLCAYPSTLESALITKRAVWAALDQLHPRRRAIVVMHELEGMDVPAIASLLGLSGMTVRWHLSMGRHDLKQLLKPFMGEKK